jgi:AcrR family transcriptional regulator
MPEPPVKPRRAYDSSRRLEQAEQTRRRILDAALLLFGREGYAATSVAAVAREAGVSVKTTSRIRSASCAATRGRRCG